MFRVVSCHDQFTIGKVRTNDNEKRESCKRINKECWRVLNLHGAIVGVKLVVTIGYE